MRRTRSCRANRQQTIRQCCFRSPHDTDNARNDRGCAAATQQQASSNLLFDPAVCLRRRRRRATRASGVLLLSTLFTAARGALVAAEHAFVGSPTSVARGGHLSVVAGGRSRFERLPRLLHREDRSLESRARTLERSRGPCRGIAGPASWSSASRKAWKLAGTLSNSCPSTGESGSRWSSKRPGATDSRGKRRDRGVDLGAVGGGGEGEDKSFTRKKSKGVGGDDADSVGDDTTSVRGSGEGAGIGEKGKKGLDASEEDSWVKRRWRYALAKIKKEPLQTLTIPVSAACVGWITNKLAVEMIFHPLVWRGLPLRVVEGQPLGLVGWQGIVPAKAGVMAERMVDMVTTQLVDVEQVFSRLSPARVARLLGPEINTITQGVCDDLLPEKMTWVPGGFAAGLPPQAVDELKGLRRQMLRGLTTDMQKQITKVLDLKEMVVGEMLRDRSLMVSLFQRCGKAEFKFLVNSGFFFGFLLGLIQMFVWLLYDKPWTLPAGGAIVGYITNWVALKLIFEPVDPVKLGPFVLQGLFLRRQNEVAADFAEFFSNNVLTSKKLWAAMLDGSRAQAFSDLVSRRVVPFVSRASAVAGANLDPVTVRSLAARAVDKLRDHVHVLHEYTDHTLALRETMTVQMQKMSTRTFEGVLHPVFQEEEFTLIVAGAVLGAIAGFLQMLLSTKGVREAARNAASVAAARAAAAADGVVEAGEGLVGGVAGPGAQATVTSWRQRASCTARRCLSAADRSRWAVARSITSVLRTVAAAVADWYHRRRRRNQSERTDTGAAGSRSNVDVDSDNPSSTPPSDQ